MEKTLLIIMVLFFFVGACSDAKDASNKNFLKAVNNYLEYKASKGVYCIGKGPYPYKAAVLADPAAVLEKVGLINRLGGPVDC